MGAMLLAEDIGALLLACDMGMLLLFIIDCWFELALFTDDFLPSVLLKVLTEFLSEKLILF